jgi:hypothetical protein
MAKIICPNKQYSGVSASVSFLNGVGETADERLISWFRAHGYDVEDADSFEPPDVNKPKNKYDKGAKKND